MLERPVTSARAIGLRRYPSCAIASTTRWRVSGRTWRLPLITRDTVWCETPASRPTSDITAARRGRSRVLPSPSKSIALAHLPQSLWCQFASPWRHFASPWRLRYRIDRIWACDLDPQPRMLALTDGNLRTRPEKPPPRRDRGAAAPTHGSDLN